MKTHIILALAIADVALNIQEHDDQRCFSDFVWVDAAGRVFSDLSSGFEAHRHSFVARVEWTRDGIRLMPDDYRVQAMANGVAVGEVERYRV